MLRRGLLGALFLPWLGGCGFSPVYGRGAAGRTPAAGLAHVYVAIIPDRSGQELREALRQRLEGASGPLAPRYTLSVAYALTTEGIGIQPDSSVTFMRYRGQATWRLLGTSSGTPVLTSGTATVEDGYSVIVNQYFYGNLAGDAITERMAKTLADQIVVRLAFWFRARDQVAAR